MYGQVVDTPPSQSPTQTQASPALAATNLTLYIVFGVASVVFVIVVVVIVRLLKRKSANPGGYTLTSTGQGNQALID